MLLFFLLFFGFYPEADAKTMRIVHLSDSDMETVFVEPGFSTLLKFDSHPEPGLIGDQDGFKVEYMRNLVSIKPLVSKARTNLFLFTKEGEFNFQLVASRGRHDDIVYVRAGAASRLNVSGTSRAIMVDDLLTRKLNKGVSGHGIRMALESIAMPRSHSTLVLHLCIEQEAKVAIKIEPSMLSVSQGGKEIAVENAYLESKLGKTGKTAVSGLMLLRTDTLAPHKPLILDLTISPGKTLSVPFSADLGSTSKI